MKLFPIILNNKNNTCCVSRPNVRAEWRLRNGGSSWSIQTDPCCGRLRRLFVTERKGDGQTRISAFLSSTCQTVSSAYLHQRVRSDSLHNPLESCYRLTVCVIRLPQTLTAMFSPNLRDTDSPLQLYNILSCCVWFQMTWDEFSWFNLHVRDDRVKGHKMWCVHAGHSGQKALPLGEG